MTRKLTRELPLWKVCKMLNLSYYKVHARLYQHGWSYCEAIEWCPRPKSLKQRCKEVGINYHTVLDRMRKFGWSEKEAMETPVKGKRVKGENYD